MKVLGGTNPPPPAEPTDPGGCTGGRGGTGAPAPREAALDGGLVGSRKSASCKRVERVSATSGNSCDS